MQVNTAEPVRHAVGAPIELIGPDEAMPLVPQRPQPVAQAGHEAASLLQVISAAAENPNVDIDKLERLMAMYERMQGQSKEAAFNDAMNKAQAEMGPVSRNAVNKQTSSAYATYDQLDTAVRPIYTSHGFSISFNEGEGAPEGHVRILAYVSHSAGHTRTYKADLPNDGKGAKGGDVMTKTHATGSAHSYGRRYLLKDIFNIAVGELDNDGNGDDEGRRQERGYTPAEKLAQVLIDSGNAEAKKGMAALTKWWGTLNARERSQHSKAFGEMRKVARRVDEERGAE